MKCIILAAGYATRLYPLTENFPKPLLEVQGKTILNWLLEDIGACGRIDEYVVVSNHRFAEIFRSWAAEQALPVTVLDDGTESNETRLGAVRDVQFAIEQLGIDDELMIMAGDNLLDFSLKGFFDFQREKKTSCTMRFWEADVNRLRRTGVAKVDEGGRIVSMVEKPAEPESNWCIPPFYILTREDAAKIKEALDSGCGYDAPGSFIAWLSGHSAVHAFEMPGRRYDIGTVESYEYVKENYVPVPAPGL